MSTPNKEITLKMYADPGHSWLAVKMHTAFVLGVLSSISHYSYIRGKTLYAEYHSDAGKIVEALKAAGYIVHLEYKHTDKQSPIRSYNASTTKNIMEAIVNDK